MQNRPEQDPEGKTDILVERTLRKETGGNKKKTKREGKKRFRKELPKHDTASSLTVTLMLTTPPRVTPGDLKEKKIKKGKNKKK